MSLLLPCPTRAYMTGSNPPGPPNKQGHPRGWPFYLLVSGWMQNPLGSPNARSIWYRAAPEGAAPGKALSTIPHFPNFYFHPSSN